MNGSHAASQNWKPLNVKIIDPCPDVVRQETENGYNKNSDFTLKSSLVQTLLSFRWKRIWANSGLFLFIFVLFNKILTEKL